MKKVQKKTALVKTKSSSKKTTLEKTSDALLDEIRLLIDQARIRVSQAVNASLVTLNWHIGNRIRKEILGQKRAEYGEQIVATLAQRLTADYGKGFTKQNLFI